MATRKTTDSPAARDAAGELIAPALNGPGEIEQANDAARQFETAEFETATSRVAGETVTLRRVVLTGPWEVAPK
jgi:hypothetical protein